MATTTVPKNMSLDIVEADVCSGDSLSFAGIVCINDQHSPPKIAPGIQEQDPEFEFGHATLLGTTAGILKEDSLPNDLFSKRQNLPQAVAFQLNQTQVPRLVSFKDDLSPPTHSSRRRWSINESGLNKASKKNANAGQRFGQKIFSSFANPCKNCRAVEPSPSMNVHSLQQGNIKSTN